MIRPATPADLPAIRAIASQTPQAAQWSEQHYDALAAGGGARIVLVADDGGEIAGFVVAHAVAGECELENIAVAAPARRRGLARSLVAELVQTAVQRGFSAIHLEVRAGNAAARRLYESCGFGQAGSRRRYYDCPPEDAILYSLALHPATPEIG